MEKEKLFYIWTDIGHWEFQDRDYHTTLSSDKKEVKPNQDLYLYSVVN